MMGTEDLQDTKLHEAVRLGDAEETQVALKEGHDPNQIGTYQWSALHEASNNGDLDIVELLLQYEGDPNKADLLCGSTAVHYAASQGHADCLGLLLAARGRHDICNNDQKTPLSIATGECKPLLQKHSVKAQNQERTNTIGDKHNLHSPPSRDVLLENILSETKPQDANNNSNFPPTLTVSSGTPPSGPGNPPSVSGSRRGTLPGDEIEVTSTSPDAVSIDTVSEVLSWNSLSSSSSRPQSRAWGADRIVGLKKEPVLGHMKLSFEYNSKKKSFKIRVWEVMDLLLPPPDTSMISGIYVKSFLQPDKRKQTKRKSEEVKVSSVLDTKSTPNSQIFKPVSFPFKKALIYEGIDQDMVNEKIVEIEVCVTQRFTRKSFIIATWNIPLSMATRKLRKERYPLRPCISTSIPTSMRVYNGSDVRSGGSCGSLSRDGSVSSLDSWATPYSPEEIVVERRGRCSATSIEMGENDVTEDAELQDALQQIEIMERKERQREYIELSPIMPGSMGDGLTDVTVNSPAHVTEVQIHITSDDVAITSSPDVITHDATKTSLGLDYSGARDKLSVPEKDSRRRRRKKNVDKSPSAPVKGSLLVSSSGDYEINAGIISGTDKEPDQISITQPDTLDWDDYSEPLSFSEAPPPPGFGGNASPGTPASPTSPVLPMAFGFSVPEVHTSFSRSQGRQEPRESRGDRPAMRAQSRDPQAGRGKDRGERGEDEESRIGYPPDTTGVTHLLVTTSLNTGHDEESSIGEVTYSTRGRSKHSTQAQETSGSVPVHRPNKARVQKRVNQGATRTKTSKAASLHRDTPTSIDMPPSRDTPTSRDTPPSRYTPTSRSAPGDAVSALAGKDRRKGRSAGTPDISLVPTDSQKMYKIPTAMLAGHDNPTFDDLEWEEAV